MAPDDPLNWGVPDLAFSDYTSLNDVAPSQRDSQTFSLSESFGWVRGKHHLHFGGDYRWIDNKAYASSNPRGTFHVHRFLHGEVRNQCSDGCPCASGRNRL